MAKPSIRRRFSVPAAPRPRPRVRRRTAPRRPEWHFRTAPSLKVRRSSVDILTDGTTPVPGKGRPMRITRRVNVPGLPGVEDSSTLVPLSRPTSDDARGANAEATSADRVELSADARLRQRLRADVGAVEHSDAARVASLRARVVADAYRP